MVYLSLQLVMIPLQAWYFMRFRSLRFCRICLQELS